MAPQRVEELVETEIRRIAHALHDEASQMLTAVHIRLAEMGASAPADCAARVQAVIELLSRVEDRLRQISHELRPILLEDLGLTPALRSLAAATSERTGIAIHLDSTVEGRLPPDIETLVYRAVQEALNNIGRHSRASEATVYLRPDAHQVHCRVRDNGIGFDAGAPARPGLGLKGLRERIELRGGRFDVDSSPGKGTTIAVNIPL